MKFDLVSRVREHRPIVHCISNYVTSNDCANILLACGASPIMSDEPDEAEDVVSFASAVCLNLGTPNERKFETMKRAGRAANARGIPVILDPVGAGSSRHRTGMARELLDCVRFSVIRGNASEIRALYGIAGATGGVDAAAGEGDAADVKEIAKKLAEKTHAVVSASGVTDIVTDGARVYMIHNGHPMMSAVTGTGCQLSVLTAAFAAVCGNDFLSAAATAAAEMGLAGELAHEMLRKGEGSGTYRARIIDVIYGMTGEVLEKGARYEI